jgi:hypothetical protein
MTAWRRHLIDDDAGIRALLEAHARDRRARDQDAGDAAAGLLRGRVREAAGYEIVPVPVYYPEVTEILGEPCIARWLAVPGPVDMVERLSRAARHRRARRRHPREAPGVGLVPARHPQRRRRPSASRVRASTSCRTAVCSSRSAR